MTLKVAVSLLLFSLTLSSAAQNTTSPPNLPSPPPDPNAQAGSGLLTPGVSLSITTLDSFNKEVGAKASFTQMWGLPPSWRQDRTGLVRPDSGCKPATLWNKSPASVVLPWDKCNAFTLVNIGASYDDKWKSSALSTSNVTQNYSALGVNLSRLFGFPLTLLASEYHNNTQGIRLDQEYGTGTYGRWPWQGSNGKKDTVLLISGGLRSSSDNLYKTSDSVNRIGLGNFIQIGAGITKKASISGSFKGFVPFINPLVYGNASGDMLYDYDLADKWAFELEVGDTYYATVPTGFRPNSFSASLGLKYKNQAK